MIKSETNMENIKVKPEVALQNLVKEALQEIKGAKAITGTLSAQLFKNRREILWLRIEGKCIVGIARSDEAEEFLKKHFADVHRIQFTNDYAGRIEK